MKPAKGLGTGLGALFGDAAVEGESNDFEYIQIQRIEPRPNQPRSVFEQEKIDELADSIREHGMLSPLTVRSLDSGYYQIIAGERRWRAARAAGLNEIPARVVDADDRKATEIALVENLQREDLNPIEEARGYKTLINEFGLTQEEVSLRVSKSRPSVANSLRLLTLPSEIVEMVGNGELSSGSARALLSLKSKALILAAAETAVKKNMSVREVEALVKKPNAAKPIIAKKDDKKSSGNKVDYIKDAQNRLTTSLGRRVTIKHGKNRGKIELEYYSQDDFDALFDVLTSIGGNNKNM